MGGLIFLDSNNNDFTFKNSMIIQSGSDLVISFMIFKNLKLISNLKDGGVFYLNQNNYDIKVYNLTFLSLLTSRVNIICTRPLIT